MWHLTRGRALLACGALLLAGPGAQAQVTAEAVTYTNAKGLPYKRGFNFPSDANRQKYEGMPYTLFVPFNYPTSDPTTKYPVIIYLHGGLGGGSLDGKSARDNGIGWHLDQAENLTWKQNFPYFVLFPQSVDYGGEWDDDRWKVIECLKQVVSRYRIDPAKVVLTGFSRGARAVWELVHEYPSAEEPWVRWAAIVAVAGWHPDYPNPPRPGSGIVLTHTQRATLAAHVDETPCYLFHAEGDNDVDYKQSVQIYNGLRNFNGDDPLVNKKWKLTLYGEISHSKSLDNAFRPSDDSADVYDWIENRLYPPR